MTTYPEGQQHLAARCRHCDREQGQHLSAGSIAHYACPLPLTTRFEAKPGDQWCGWCDDWLVNCRCDEEEPGERLE